MAQELEERDQHVASGSPTPYTPDTSPPHHAEGPGGRLADRLRLMPLGNHLCLIHDTAAQQFAATVPFIAGGLDSGERCLYIVDENSPERVISALQEAGIDTAEAIRSGALLITDKHDTYLKGGSFDPDRMIAVLQEATDQALRDGFGGLRVTGEMTWALDNGCDRDELLEYESKLNYFFADQPASAICQYHAKRFPAETLLGVIETHPLVVYGDLVCRNYYHVPPDELLDQGDASAEVTRLLTNISTHQEAEEALKVSEDRFRSLVQDSSDVKAVVDADGLLSYISPAVTRLSGHYPEDLVGTLGFSFIHPDHVAIVNEAMQRMLAAGEGHQEVVEARSKTKDGDWIWIEIRARNALLNPSVKGIVLNYHDISERKNRQLLEEEVRQAQKLEALGRLAGGIAHDFNNLLSVILNYTHFLHEDLTGSDGRSEDVMAIREAADRAVVLVRQLLAFSRKDLATPELVDVNEVVLGIQKMLTRVIGEDINLRVDRSPEVGSVLIDRGHLEQILMNLAVNARDAMPNGGDLTLRTSCGDEGDAKVVLEIIDTGSGMDEEVRSHLFEPFFTTKPQGKGTGLGLATVYGIVQQAGGKIDVTSEPGRGSTFRVTFPATTETAVGSDQSQERTAFGGSETVLVIEDEAAVRRSLERILARVGYHVAAAEDPAEALDLVASGLRPDIVLSDVIMPNMSGIELVRELRRTLPDVPAIFMSGYTTETVQARGLLTDGDTFLQKPYSQGNLLHALRSQLDQHEPGFVQV